MKASLNWLKRLVDLRESPEEIAAHLTAAGLEVEEVTRIHELPGVVVGEVRSCEKVEGTKLSSCRVFDGTDELAVVCGAPNVRAGLKVAFATVGTVLPEGLEIKPAVIRGMESFGMLCAEDELGLGEGHAGIMELDPSLVPGTPFSAALELADVVFEINVTPNRPDATGHLGLARELALRLERPLRDPRATLRFERSGRPTSVPVSVEPGCGCTRYVGRTLHGLSNGPSPAWMQSLLRAVGLRPISALVDVTNFVMLETGQPLHAFDLSKLAGPEVVVRGARAGESLELLDGRNLTLTVGDLSICDRNGPQCLGGVMGGAATGVSESTTSIFLETAFFQASTVRFLARRTQASSDSSYRFERGVDPFATLSVSDYATSLILAACGGTADEPLDILADAHPRVPRTVHLAKGRVAGLLGADDIPDETVDRLLTGVGCAKVSQDAQGSLWSLPGWRPDLSLDADLVEEVARLVGYDNLPTAFPTFPVSAVRLPARERWTRRLRRALAARGLSETLSLRLTSQADHDRLGLPPEDPRATLTGLMNPISDETACLPRLGVLGLLRGARHNEKRQQRSVRLFECARVFGRDLPEPFAAHRTTGVGEAWRLSGLVAGPWPERAWTGSEVPADLWRAKGALQGALRDLGLEVRFSPSGTEPWLHPGRQAEVFLGEALLGVFGQLHPTVQEAFSLRDEAFVWELDLDLLVDRLESRSPVASRRIGEFPATRREVNVLVDRARPADEVVRLVAGLPQARHELVEEVSLVSVYEGAGVPQGQKAVLVRASFRAHDRTLTDAEVNLVQDALRQELASQPGLSLK
ncbi:MAG: phenylalanine--tRNA ligase subunit beta [Fibrobacteria bacterium]|nr:phenylalanine--tRNA ligase subunit beta [Fibrobacteria bacterium]